LKPGNGTRYTDAARAYVTAFTEDTDLAKRGRGSGEATIAPHAPPLPQAGEVERAAELRRYVPGRSNVLTAEVKAVRANVGGE
jgi:hypothetical protein